MSENGTKKTAYDDIATIKVSYTIRATDKIIPRTKILLRCRVAKDRRRRSAEAAGERGVSRATGCCGDGDSQVVKFVLSKDEAAIDTQVRVKCRDAMCEVGTFPSLEV